MTRTQLSPPDRPPPPDVFSVSRRFDLATILVAMLGYAILFGSMQLAGIFPPAALAVAGSFFAVIAIAQGLTIRSKRPREASIVAGGVFWIIGAFMFISLETFPYNSCAYAAAVVIALVAGPISGYLAGTLVGGVFLISHYLREADLFRRRTPQAADEADSPWGPPTRPESKSPEAESYDWPIMVEVPYDERADQRPR